MTNPEFHIKVISAFVLCSDLKSCLFAQVQVAISKFKDLWFNYNFQNELLLNSQQPLIMLFIIQY